VHNNYYFLRQLTSSLRQVIKGAVVSECYSQAKDEIILRFETHSGSYFIKANLNPSFSIISFPPTVERAKKNSIDLFPAMIGYRVTDVRQFLNERCFALELEEGKTFLFKMHGNRSNVILFEGRGPVDRFRKNLLQDASLDLDALDKLIDWSYDSFLMQQDEPEKLYFTFGKLVWLYLKEKGFNTAPTRVKWELIQSVLHQLEEPSYFLTRIRNSLHLSLLPLCESTPISGTPLEVSNRFFIAYTQEFAIEREKANAIANVRSKIGSSRNYYEKNFQKLAEIEQDTNYKSWADLIMANMHQLKQGVDKVVLPDFYHEGQMVEIRMKKELSPQQNAAVYYRKAKNQHIEIERLQQSLEAKEKEIERLNKLIDELNTINDLKTLRRKVQQLGINAEAEKQPESLPYFEFEKSGYRILVGKNAEANDELTLRYSYKEDLWLHAKDVTGSHVLIKYQAGKKFPKDVIERAAELAAYNSKRKTETLCPVVVTPKKYVRKRKGDPAGAVVIEREEVILVEPKL
jgi:predicted ribosome quality control (RQC) complex YloA/Tae2 family protein